MQILWASNNGLSKLVFVLLKIIKSTKLNSGFFSLKKMTDLVLVFITVIQEFYFKILSANNFLRNILNAFIKSFQGFPFIDPLLSSINT
jgi:hypothetical protein